MELIIFDCDGVLVDSEAILVEAELDFFMQHGVEMKRDSYIDQFMGIPMDDWKVKASELIGEKYHTPISDDFFKPLEDSISKRIKEELLAIDGACQAISSLNKLKCVASSSSIRSLKSKLTQTGLLNLFDPHIFSTQLVEHGKPAPDLFLHAANELNVLPNECVVVEDSANGVLAGKRAGMQVIGFIGGGHCPPGHSDALLAKGADFIATDYSDLVKNVLIHD